MTFTEFVHSNLISLPFLAYACLAWVGANYIYPNDPVATGAGSKLALAKRWRWLLIVVLRSLCAGILTYFASGHSICAAAYITVLAIAFSIVRSQVSPRQLAETELAGNVLYVSGLIRLAFSLHLPLSSWGIGRFEPGHVAAVILIASIVIYVEIGGTNIVRGLLEKGRILPKVKSVPKEENASAPANGQPQNPENKKVDEDEYNHGRLIGNVERLLLLALVAIQAYQALAFLMTAKGLFRAKELESRSFSEYFLVGTLVSSLVAVAAGLIIQLVIKLCW